MTNNEQPESTRPEQVPGSQAPWRPQQPTGEQPGRTQQGQPDRGEPQAYPGEPPQTQAYPPRPHAYPGQPVQGQYPSQPPQTQPYPGQGQYPGQPAQGRPYPGQPQTTPPAPVQPQPDAGPQIPGQRYTGQAQQPAQGYSGQRFAGSVQQPGYQPPQAPGYSAYANQVGMPQPPAGGNKKVMLRIAIGVGVAIIAAVAVNLVLRNLGGEPNGDPGGTGSTAASSTAATAVEDYLKALAASDADAALAFAATPPTDTSMLTKEVLAAAQAAAPITDIVVEPGTGTSSQTVTARYKLGGTEVSTSFATTNVAGAWRLDAVAAPLPLDTSSAFGIPLTVNGVALSTETASSTPVLFPGRYQVEVADKWYEKSGVSVDVSVTDDTVDRPRLSPKLSSAGVSAIRKAAQAKLKSCLSKKSLAPSGCGYRVDLPGAKPRTSTIRWSSPNGAAAMKKLKPKALSTGIYSSSVKVSLQMNCSSTDGRRWAGKVNIRTVMSTLTPGKVSVGFA